MVGSMENLVNEVLQAAVGNLFRDKIGGMEAIKFIQTRQIVQEEAFEYIQKKLAEYEIETRGVYIQDVVYPAALVTVLTRARSRSPASGDLQDAEAGAGPAHRDREGPRYCGHAGAAGASRRSASISRRTTPRLARPRPTVRPPTSSAPALLRARRFAPSVWRVPRPIKSRWRHWARERRLW